MASSLKRKGSSDFDLEACVALPKRYRLDPDLPVFEANRSTCSMAEEMPDFQEDVRSLETEMARPTLKIVELDAEEELGETSDERALVLYKPVTPPLFPGGPPPGSSDLPISLDTSYLQDDKGFWKSQSNLTDFFRFKSTASFMGREAISIDAGDNQLAVVPWVPSQFHPLADEPLWEQQIVIDNQNDMQVATEDDDVTMMDTEQEDPMQQPESNTNTASSSSISSCNSAATASEIASSDGLQQWQHFLPSQPPLNQPVMWSC